MNLVAGERQKRFPMALKTARPYAQAAVGHMQK